MASRGGARLAAALAALALPAAGFAPRAARPVSAAPLGRAAAARVSLAAGAWLPVGSTSGLTGLGPQRIEICGEAFAVWQHEATGEWSVLADACPHRLAPLSQGRIDEETGCIECPYHGWQFDGNGVAKAVPQIEDEKLLASGKLDARALPTKTTGDLLWAFFDEALTGEGGGSKHITPDVLYPSLLTAAEKGIEYFVRELPYSFDFLIENFMDPAHIPFAHHGLQGVRTDGSPIPSSVLVSNETHVEVNFKDSIRGKAREGVVSFERPARYHFRLKNENNTFKEILIIYGVPVKAGRCRVIFASPVQNNRVPQWLQHAASNRFLSTDVWLHDAEKVARKGPDAPLDPRDRYITASSSDVGPSAFRSWWKANQANAPYNTYGAAKFEDLIPQSRAEMIDPWVNHASTCAHCRNALNKANIVTRASLAVLALALLAPGFSVEILVAKAVAATLAAATTYAARRAASAIEGEAQPSRVAQRSVAATGK
ncbi:hypothetical protein M885DRAFT_488578 [Pelagophyceae sp. CCMP2097]|nr:hypothetical protein M885DRAFT_488578 [Pelagophyceae sp. CCMP2097]